MFSLIILDHLSVNFEFSNVSLIKQKNWYLLIIIHIDTYFVFILDIFTIFT